MLNIFLLSANPIENSKLNVDIEFNKIDEELNKSECKKEFNLKKVVAVNYDNLLDTLMTDNPCIIHFAGHGEGEDGLVFVDDKGKKKIVKTQTITQLVEVLQSKKEHIICIILNGCYTKIQAKLISPYVKYVIGMGDAVYDENAVNFAKYFYKALFNNKDIDIETAFKIACISIGHSISIIGIDKKTKHAIYDPAPEDKIEPQAISSNKTPQLIVNKNLDHIKLLNLVTKEETEMLSDDYCMSSGKKDKDSELSIGQTVRITDECPKTIENFPFIYEWDSKNDKFLGKQAIITMINYERGSARLNIDNSQEEYSLEWLTAIQDEN